MKLWRLFPVVLFVGVLVAATVGFAVNQPIAATPNLFASEGEGDARPCDEIEVEFRQSTTSPTIGHVTGVKLHYPSGTSPTSCGDERAGIEIHNLSPGHGVMCSGSEVLSTSGSTSISCSPAIPNLPGPCAPTKGCVKDIGHINIVITDLPPP